MGFEAWESDAHQNLIVHRLADWQIACRSDVVLLRMVYVPLVLPAGKSVETQALQLTMPPPTATELGRTLQFFSAPATPRN